MKAAGLPLGRKGLIGDVKSMCAANDVPFRSLPDAVQDLIDVYDMRETLRSMWTQSQKLYSTSIEQKDRMRAVSKDLHGVDVKARRSSFEKPTLNASILSPLVDKDFDIHEVSIDGESSDIADAPPVPNAKSRLLPHQEDTSLPVLEPLATTRNTLSTPSSIEQLLREELQEARRENEDLKKALLVDRSAAATAEEELKAARKEVDDLKILDADRCASMTPSSVEQALREELLEAKSEIDELKALERAATTAKEELEDASREIEELKALIIEQNTVATPSSIEQSLREELQQARREIDDLKILDADGRVPTTPSPIEQSLREQLLEAKSEFAEFKALVDLQSTTTASVPLEETLENELHEAKREAERLRQRVTDGDLSSSMDTTLRPRRCSSVFLTQILLFFVALLVHNVYLRSVLPPRADLYLISRSESH